MDKYKLIKLSITRKNHEIWTNIKTINLSITQIKSGMWTIIDDIGEAS